jgi:uncharacterized repeat protein (TIGR01451 family)
MNLSRTLRSAALLGALAVTVALPARAALTPRVQITQSGDFVILGNTQGQDCGPGVPAPVVGNASAACGGNTSDTSPDISWEADFPAAGQATADLSIGGNKRTTAVLNLPAGAVVTHAYLYWAATRFVPTIDANVSFDRPGVFTATANAVQSFSASAGMATHSQSVADVTALVQANGPGAYRVGDLDSAKLAGVDQDVLFAGWWMVVLYKKAGAPLRRLAIFDGLDIVSPGVPSAVTATGFLIPSAAAAGKLGVIGFDGDDQNTGDSLTVNGIALSNAVNPSNNFFNSTRSNLGLAVSVPGDLPQLTGGPRSMSQIDLDVADISIATFAGQSTAAIQANTTNDIFVLGGLVTSIATAAPDLASSTKTVIDLNGGAVVAGDVLQYTVTVTNTGADTATGVVLSDPLPPSVTFVPGSIAVTQGPNQGLKTDAAGDDEAEYDAATSKVTARLGAFAGLGGGSLAPGASTTVTFEVIINAGASGSIANQGSISAAGLLGAPVQVYPTDGNGAAAGAPPTVIAVDPTGASSSAASSSAASSSVASSSVASSSAASSSVASSSVASSSSSAGVGGGSSVGASSSSVGAGGSSSVTAGSSSVGVGGSSSVSAGSSGGHGGNGGATATGGLGGFGGAGGRGGSGGGGEGVLVQGGCLCDAPGTSGELPSGEALLLAACLSGLLKRRRDRR